MRGGGGLFKSPLRHHTLSEMRFRSLPLLAVGYRVRTTESAVSEVKLSLCGTPTSFS